MYRRPEPNRMRAMIERIKRLFKWKREPESPDDPYAMVGAPKKPRPPHRSAAAAAELD